MKKYVNGIAVNTFGNEKKRAIIFIHGFPFDHTMWEKQIKVLQKKYFCVAYDVRGLGESRPGDGQYTMENFVDDLFEIIEKLKLEKPIVCGLSMGGYIALRAVERDETKFGGLILCDTRSEADTDEARINRGNRLKKINEEGTKKFVADFVTPLFCDITLKSKKKIVNSIIVRSQKNKPAGIKGALIAILSRTDTTKYLRKIKIPALVLVGSLDALTPPTSMREMAKKIKTADFGIAPRAGHLSPVENPGFVNDMILGFLKKIN